MSDSTADFNFDQDAELAGYDPDARVDAPMRPIPEGRYLFRWNFVDKKFLNEPFDKKRSSDERDFIGVRVQGAAIASADANQPEEEFMKYQVRSYIMSLATLKGPRKGTSSMTDFVKGAEGGEEALRAQKLTYSRLQEVVQDLMASEPEVWANIKWTAQFKDSAGNYHTLAKVAGFEQFYKGAKVFPKNEDGTPKHYWRQEIEGVEYDVYASAEVDLFVPYRPTE